MATTEFLIAKDGHWQHVFPMDIPAAVRLSAKIEPGDAYIFDDTAVLDVPAAPAGHRVKLAGEERSCLKEILAANRRVELVQGDTQGQVIQVIDGQTPEKLPAGPALIFTPGDCDLWQLGDAVADPSVTRVDDGSPIMADVWLVNAYLPEARQLRIAESVRAVARPILMAEATPLGYAIDRPQGRVVVIAGDLATSNLALQAGFPRLIAQALDWLDGQQPWKDEVVGWDQRAGTMYSWSTSAGPPILAVSSGTSDNGARPGERPPRQVENLSYSQRDRNVGQSTLQKFMTGQVENLSYGQGDPCGTDIRVPDDIGGAASAVVVQEPWPPLWIVPAALAAVLLIIEWCLYQRRWTS